MFLKEKTTHRPYLFSSHFLRDLYSFLIVVLLVFCYYTQIRIDDWNHPMQLWRKNAHHYPGSDFSHHNYAELFVKTKESAQERHATVIHHYKKALELDACSDAPALALASLYMDFGEIDLAIETLLSLINCNPRYAPAYNNLGVAYNRKGDIVNAIASYKKGISIEESNDEFDYDATDVKSLHYNWGHNLLNYLVTQGGPYIDALYPFEKVYSMQNDFLQIRVNYGAACHNQGQWHVVRGQLDDGIKYLNKAVELNPDSIDSKLALNHAVQLKQKEISQKTETVTPPSPPSPPPSPPAALSPAAAAAKAAAALSNGHQLHPQTTPPSPLQQRHPKRKIILKEVPLF